MIIFFQNIQVWWKIEIRYTTSAAVHHTLETILLEFFQIIKTTVETQWRQNIEKDHIKQKGMVRYYSKNQKRVVPPKDHHHPRHRKQLQHGKSKDSHFCEDSSSFESSEASSKSSKHSKQHRGSVRNNGVTRTNTPHHQNIWIVPSTK
jgi:hypothetical protein